MIREPLPHDSAALHVAGAARYIDDLPEPPGTLYAALGVSTEAFARIKSIDLDAVRRAPGVVSVVTAADIPGANNIGPVMADEPVFATDTVQFLGQPLFAVAATSVELARRAARLAKVDYEALEPVVSIEQALEKQQFVLPTLHV
ncbi:MAG TPA: xanthine dehydrogenase molybdopterin binding subunit, partial [Burkholderiales bacterium]|nr:xanthine dehydrogenase molybdopterin binding subunit [Burkholderiales bacterium]